MYMFISLYVVLYILFLHILLIHMFIYMLIYMTAKEIFWGVRKEDRVGCPPPPGPRRRETATQREELSPPSGGGAQVRRAPRKIFFAITPNKYVNKQLYLEIYIHRYLLYK